MSKYIVTMLIAVFMMVGLVTDATSAQKGGKGTFEAQMIPFGSNSGCGEVKINTTTANLRLEVKGATCAPADTTFTVCLFWAEGAEEHTEVIGTPATGAETELIFNKDLDAGAGTAVPGISVDDALEDVVVQLRDEGSDCTDGSIIAASGVNI